MTQIEMTLLFQLFLNKYSGKKVCDIFPDILEDDVHFDDLFIDGECLKYYEKWIFTFHVSHVNYPKFTCYLSKNGRHNFFDIKDHIDNKDLI